MSLKPDTKLEEIRSSDEENFGHFDITAHNSKPKDRKKSIVSDDNDDDTPFVGFPQDDSMSGDPTSTDPSQEDLSKGNIVRNVVRELIKKAKMSLELDIDFTFELKTFKPDGFDCQNERFMAMMARGIQMNTALKGPNAREWLDAIYGSLMYLAIKIRPDIAYTVNMLSQFNIYHNCLLESPKESLALSERHDL